MLTEDEKEIGNAMAYSVAGLRTAKYKCDLEKMRVSEDNRVAMMPFENSNHKFFLKITVVE